MVVTSPPSPASGCTLRLPENSNNSQFGKGSGGAAGGQLVRAVMDLLKSFEPQDPPSLACLVTAVAQLSLHGQSYALLPQLGAHVEVEDSSAVGASKEKGTADDRRMVLGPVNASLREQAEQHLLGLLSPQEEAAATSLATGPAVNSDSRRTGAWFAAAFHVLSREFASAICLPPAANRLSNLLPDPGKSTTTTTLGMSTTASSTTGTKSGSGEGSVDRRSGGNSSFLVSLAKMMSLSIEYEQEEHEEQTSVEGGAGSEGISSSGATGEDSLLRLVRVSVQYTASSEENGEGNAEVKWMRLQVSASSLQLLAAAVSGGLPAMAATEEGSTSEQLQCQQTLRHCLFIAGD